MGLADLVEQYRTEIVERWLERAYAGISPRAVPRADVLDEVSDVVQELVRSLRRDVIDERTAAAQRLARSHGRQRFHAGYDIAAVVREHEVLRDVILEVATEKGYRPDLAEIGSLGRFLFSALADAASTYAIERDREVSEQAERYIGFLAHELRNPLGTAQMALTLLRDKGQIADAPASRSLDRALGKMHELIDGALTEFAQRQAPRAHRTALDLGRFIGEVIAEAAAEAESKGVSTSVDISAPAVIQADPRLLRSAVSNLVRNAIKFSRPGSEVRVEVKRVDQLTSIAVTDGCGGLPPGSVQRLFNPFVQAGADRSGFGLGLAIAQQAAAAHDGAIRVHDLPGHGCVFVLDIPDAA